MKRKLAALFTGACLMCGFAFGLTACKDKTAGEHEHVWNEGTVTTESTCTAEGEKTFECTVKNCKETKTEPVSKKEHNWNGGNITEQPTCSVAGTKTYSCQNEGCDATREEPVDKVAHSWDAGVITAVPDINSKGEITYTCGVCTATDKKAVDARADFKEQFYTSVTQENCWQYGAAAGFNPSTGGFTFGRILQTDVEKPAVWKAEGVEINAGGVSSAGNAVIAYTVKSESGINISVKFTGEEEGTRLSAYLVIKDKDGAVKDGAAEISEDAKDWSYSTEEAVVCGKNDTLYIVFANGGEGKPCGGLQITYSAACFHEWDEGEPVKEANCQEFGEVLYTCGKCGEHKTLYTPKAQHSFTGDWVEVTGGHARKCLTCTEVDTEVESHDMRDVEQIDAQTMKTRCSKCGKEGTREILPDCAQGTAFGGDGANHWYICATHGDVCGTKYEIEAHDYATEITEDRHEPTCGDDGYKVMQCECGKTQNVTLDATGNHSYPTDVYVKDEDNGTHHHQVCGTCGNPSQSVEHTWNAGEVTTRPTLTAGGVKTYTCMGCGHTKTESIAANADFTREFSTTNNPNGAWAYGKSNNYDFGNNSFDFEQATIEDGADAWKAGSSQIKNNWIDGGETTIAYTVTEGMSLDAFVSFKGTLANSRMAMRIVVKDASGAVKEAKFYADGQSAKDWAINTSDIQDATLNLDAGDTVYFIFFNEGHDAGNNDHYPQGEIQITLTKKA